MTDIQLNKMAMGRNVSAYLDSTNTTWAAIAQISDISSKIKAIIIELDDLGEIQVTDQDGLTINKSNIRTQLIQAMMNAIRALKAYAQINNNPHLYEQVNFTQSELEKTREDMLDDKAEVIFEIARQHEAELEDLLLTRDQITDIQNLTTQYRALMPAKRQANVVIKGATAEIKLKFKEFDQTLTQLDNLIPIFQHTNPQFVRGYFDSRIIIDLGHRPTSSTQTIIEGKVTNLLTGQPLDTANVEIIGTGLSATTGPDGLFSINVNETGDYTPRATKTGFNTLTHDTIHLQKGNKISIELELQPTV